MAPRFIPITLACGVLLAASGTPATAQWLAGGTPLCSAAGAQSRVRSAPDGAGGVFVVWVDNRLGGQDIYGLRILASGQRAPNWPENGVAVCVASGAQLTPEIVADGVGGAFVVWKDGRRGSGDDDIFIQRIIASGRDPLWPADGIALCDTTGAQGNPQLIPDGSGGAIAVWDDQRSGFDSDIYAQRIAANGTRSWTAQGVPVCTAVNDQLTPVCAADASGGVFVAWEDARASSMVSDIYVQRITSAGVPASGWPVGGAAANLTVGLRLAYAPSIVKDASGGTIVAWEDYRNLSGDIYAVRLTAAGAVAAGWTAGGSVVCNASNDQVRPFAVSDGAGGAVVVWQEYGGGNTRDLYAQRITAAGVRAAGWPAAGTSICTANGNLATKPRAVSDGSNGVLVAWQDSRNGILTDIYAQRITGTGQVASGWTANGVPVCMEAADQQAPDLIGDGSGGAIVAWQDYRNGIVSDYDIYARRVTGAGHLVDVPGESGGLPSFRVQEPRPNPTPGPASIAFELPEEGTLDARIFDVAGRVVRVLEAGRPFSAGTHVLAWDGRDEAGAPVADGVYLLRLAAGADQQVRRIVRIR
jgi:hypothetical protein